MTPIWKLRPLDPASPWWNASSHKQEVTIRAGSENRARDIANTCFSKAHERLPDGRIIYSPWSNADEVVCERVTGGEFADGAGDAILSPAYYDAEFQLQMAHAVDFAQPIEVVDVFGHVTPAEYMQHQVMWPDRYEIIWQGEKWTVSADHHVLGSIDPGFRVRNRES